jgi:ATP-dependent RNA helicase DDX46/PRP5
MVATSVCARGLDISHIKLVVNYVCPNHLEDYVHRVGRTGRAGNTGTAITFISQDECLYAQDLILALENSNKEVS